VRGNLPCIICVNTCPRSIPACAGEPQCDWQPHWTPKVYPRVCGGTAWRHLRARHAVGLSPRVRGNPTKNPLTDPNVGSIPACAGEPVSVSDSVSDSGVYPRVCGGTLIFARGVCAVQGLSPRVRGNRFDYSRSFLRLGSIPACAGEPLSLKLGSFLHKVYPRVCGGTRISGRLFYFCVGLSPRVRGNPSASWSKLWPRWSIPACAGEPSGVDQPDDILTVYPRVCGGTALVP